LITDVMVHPDRARGSAVANPRRAGAAIRNFITHAGIRRNGAHLAVCGGRNWYLRQWAFEEIGM
jgi:hypothetical protein